MTRLELLLPSTGMAAVADTSGRMTRSDPLGRAYCWLRVFVSCAAIGAAVGLGMHWLLGETRGIVFGLLVALAD